jgi:hypothetical protein
MHLKMIFPLKIFKTFLASHYFSLLSFTSIRIMEIVPRINLK